MSVHQPTEPSGDRNGEASPEATAEEIGLFAFQVASQMSGAVTAAMIHLGDRLGLYRAMHSSGRPMTTSELAAATGLVERWVREWAYNQAAAGLVLAETPETVRLAGAAGGADTAGEADPADTAGTGGAAADDGTHRAAAGAGTEGAADTAGTEGAAAGSGTGGAAAGAEERFSLSPAAVPVLVDDTHEGCLLGMYHHLPQTMAKMTVLPESFRTGLGHDYDSHGPEAAEGVERGFEPWMRNHLLPDVLPRLDGVVDRLTAGVAAADVGCGSGAGVLRMARAYPASRFAGYDISLFALERAQELLAESGLTNATFHDPRHEPLPTDGSLTFVTTFDCLHDMTDPGGAARAIRAALTDDGTWLVAEIKAYDTFAENVRRNPVAALMYGTSVLSCMSSALSEPGGAGLGTLGMSAERLEAIAVDAGFSRFRRLEIDHPVNAFYEIRP